MVDIRLAERRINSSLAGAAQELDTRCPKLLLHRLQDICPDPQ
jgi:hypothetical protein